MSDQYDGPELARQVRMLRAAFPYCEKHAPNGGTRIGCLECAYIELSTALSRISYLCDEPNEIEYSIYDADYDAKAVVVQVERLRAALESASGKCEFLAADKAHAEALAAQQIERAERAEAERDALRADAERYRWMRGGAEVPAHSVRWGRWEVNHWQGVNGWRNLLRSELDAAIDAAMQRGKEQR